MFSGSQADYRREAMEEEILALEANNTWTLQQLSFGKKPIGYKTNQVSLWRYCWTLQS